MFSDNSTRLGLLLAVAGTAGCISTSSPSPGRDTSASVESPLASGLVQRVTISPPAPAQHQNVSIRSILRNVGSETMSLSSRICSLDYSGTLALSQPPEVGKCAGDSMKRDLAPGDSVLGFDVMRVDSPPGEYILRVRHALSPEGWYELPVRVTAH